MDTEIISGDEQSPKDFEMFSLTWEGISITLRWEPNYSPGVIAHLEIRSKNAVRFPITDTGYKSHFCDKEGIEFHGGPVAFVQKRLTQESASPDWQAFAKQRGVQSLF